MKAQVSLETAIEPHDLVYSWPRTRASRLEGKSLTARPPLAGAVSVTWFALGVQAPNYIFVIREQYQTKPDICTSLILKKKNFYFCHVIPWGNAPYVLLFCL